MLSRRSLLGLAALVSASGCYGQFALTRKLYTWNGSFGSKFLSTLLMWVMMIIPVYEVVGLIDLWILNLIEFWTGSNPLAEVTHEDGSRTRFARLAPDTVRVTRSADGSERSFDLVLTSERALLVRGLDGQVLASGEALADGSLALANASGLRVVSAADVQRIEASGRRSAAIAQHLGGLLASR